MSKATRPAPFFVADNRALDLLNSIAAPAATEVDWISDGIDLLDWLEQGDLATSEELAKFRTPDALAECNEIAAETRKLREWLREFVMAHAGHQLEPSALKELTPINKILLQGHNFKQIEKSDIALYWKDRRHWHSAKDLLLVIAEVIGDLICTVDFSLVKNCEGPTCTLWFYDISKNHSRRWCTMSICGNRAKAALHRAKKKSSKNSTTV